MPPGRKLASETLHRFGIWCGADLGLPVQFHVGYGDRDMDLHKCNPLLLTDLLRALEPTGVPVMLLHNYPYHREAGYLAQVFPNVYADLGLATHNAGSRASAVLGEALELVPLVAEKRVTDHETDLRAGLSASPSGPEKVRSFLSAGMRARTASDIAGSMSATITSGPSPPASARISPHGATIIEWP